MAGEWGDAVKYRLEDKWREWMDKQIYIFVLKAAYLQVMTKKRMKKIEPAVVLSNSQLTYVDKLDRCPYLAT